MTPSNPEKNERETGETVLVYVGEVLPAVIGNKSRVKNVFLGKGAETARALH